MRGGPLRPLNEACIVGWMQTRCLMAIAIICSISQVYTCVFIYSHKQKIIFQIRQFKDAKLSNSEGGNCFLIKLCCRRSFVLFYTSSCLRILEQNNFHYWFIARQSPFITPKFPPSPMNNITSPVDCIFLLHFNWYLMFLSRTISLMPITLLTCCSW